MRLQSVTTAPVALGARHPLGFLPTPLERLDRLAVAIGLARGGLWVKRDDVTGLALGGNKVRKLEFIVADAHSRGCDVLVVGGGAQSNAVRATAAAAARSGLGCVAVLAGRPGDPPVGNVLLDRLFGAQIEWIEEYDYDAVERTVDDVVRRLAADGKRPYRLPIGVSSPLGVRGYVAAAREIHQQAPDATRVVLATGTGGTQAGLLAGYAELASQGARVPAVLGIDIGARPEPERAVDALASACARDLGIEAPPAAEVVRGHAGEGYAAPTAGAREAMRLAARVGGLVLDPVYTAKAFAALAAMVAGARIGFREKVVFVHTGGAPGVFDGRADFA